MMIMSREYRVKKTNGLLVKVSCLCLFTRC